MPGSWAAANTKTRRTAPARANKKSHPMLYTIATILLILWLLGLVSSYTLGGLIHLFLVVALIMIIVNFFSGRKSA